MAVLDAAELALLRRVLEERFYSHGSDAGFAREVLDELRLRHGP
jgi:hypothetical protein